MKIENKHEQAYVSKNVETHQATISMTPEVFDIMISGIYSDKITAPPRELICNARDSHVEAGINKPVVIHAPTPLEPFFSVQDFGLGMSHEMVTKTYMCFGTSTKRESNELIGAKGIGSKSPFALVDAFQVCSVYNGEQTSYSVYKDKGLPKVSVLHKKQTDAPNGVEVKFAIDPSLVREFNWKLGLFLCYFDYPYEINTPIEKKPVVAFETNYEDFNVKILSDSDFRSRVVMGGVPYRSEYLSSCYRDEVIVTIPIGSCDIDPGRENTVENHTTCEFNNKLKRAVEYAEEKYLALITEQLEQFNTVLESKDWYSGLSHSATMRANEALYEKIAILKNRMISYTPRATRGSRDHLRIDALLKGDVIFMVKDKESTPMKRAKRLMEQTGKRYCFLLHKDLKIEDQPMLQGLVYKASEVVFEKQAINRQATNSSERLKGHKVYVITKGTLGVEARQVSKKDIESCGCWTVRNKVETDYSGSVTGYSQDLGHFTDRSNKDELLEAAETEEVYLLTEHQSKWANKDTKFKVNLKPEHIKLIQRSFIDTHTYNKRVVRINKLRSVLKIPGRLTEMDKVNVPNWLKSESVRKAVESKKLEEKAQAKMDSLDTELSKLRAKINTILPLFEEIEHMGHDHKDVKHYVEACLLLASTKNGQ